MQPFRLAFCVRMAEKRFTCAFLVIVSMGANLEKVGTGPNAIAHSCLLYILLAYV